MPTGQLTITAYTLRPGPAGGAFTHGAPYGVSWTTKDGRTHTGYIGNIHSDNEAEQICRLHQDGLYWRLRNRLP